MYGAVATKAPETIIDKVTGKEVVNKSAFLLDYGNCNLLHNDNIVGKIDYVTGHTEWTAPFLSAEFKVYAQTYAAHSGGLNYTSEGNNFIMEIGARSVNPIEKTQIQLLSLS